MFIRGIKLKLQSQTKNVLSKSKKKRRTLGHVLLDGHCKICLSGLLTYAIKIFSVCKIIYSLLQLS